MTRSKRRMHAAREARHIAATNEPRDFTFDRLAALLPGYPAVWFWDVYDALPPAFQHACHDNAALGLDDGLARYVGGVA